VEYLPIKLSRITALTPWENQQNSLLNCCQRSECG